MGQIIGDRFEVGSQLGQGGMGTVYHGLDTRTGQPVAIKLLRTEVVAASPGLVERFAREGEALRRLNHPNIVKMLGTVEENGSHYLVMEYVEGGSLAEMLQSADAPLPVDLVLHLALELADALSRAHHLKIIHRDIKPANILIAEDGTPRLTDFGIARIDDQSRMTESGVVVGTFSYLSPEACQGRPLDARTDIWAFGVLLYEMLTGRRPFDRDNMAATLTAILTDAPPHLWELRPDVPQALVSLVYRMLEKDRDQRLASARQVGAEIEAITRGEPSPSSLQSASRFEPTTPTPELDGPTTITPTPTTTITPKVVKRRRRAIAGGILLLLVIAVGLFILLDVPKICCSPPPPTLAAASDGYVVLVADLEPIQTASRDVARFIADDLKQQLEVEAPFSKMRVQQYPQVITTDAEALAAAEANGASVVVWGNYTAEKITLNVQIGSLAAFKYMHFDRALLERTANVRVEMTDETQQSIAPQVLGVLGMLSYADGDIFGFGRTLVALDMVNVEAVTLVGEGVSTYVHRSFAIFVADTVGALEAINQAVNLNDSNPLLYALRSQARWRLINVNYAWSANPMSVERDQAVRDAQTAQQLGSLNWATPYILLGNMIGIGQLAELRSDDWSIYAWRAQHYYIVGTLGSFELAKADIEQSIRLNPDSAFPYSLAILIALREGRLAEAAAFADIFVNQFPKDIILLERWSQTVYGEGITFPDVGPLFSVLSKLLLGQYEDAIQVARSISRPGGSQEDLGLLQGIAYCNLQRYDSAEIVYNSIIPRSEFPIKNLLSADTHQKRIDEKAARLEIQKLLRSEYSEVFAPFAAAVMNGEFGCKDLFDSAKIAEIQEKYGSVTGESIAVTLTALAPMPEPQGTPSATP